MSRPESELPRVLVTGGEGLVGSAVVARLLEAGHLVTTLTLPDATPHDGVRVVRGDARDPEAVRAACEGVDAVAHLAGIPSPWHDPAPVVFGTNTLATFTVLWTAAESGIRRFVIAGSVNATGLIMNPFTHRPDRYPVDESTRSDIADAYSLSKRTDESTLRATCRRFGASGMALRLPLMVPPASARALREWAAGEVQSGAADGWGWLDTRDGAEAFRLALTADFSGAHVVHLAARTTFQELPTEELIARYASTVPRSQSYPGHRAPIDTSRAEALLGFRPRYDHPGEA
jgi:nucleoside-diphosphate-sugar epimerase